MKEACVGITFFEPIKFRSLPPVCSFLAQSVRQLNFQLFEIPNRCLISFKPDKLLSISFLNLRANSFSQLNKETAHEFNLLTVAPDDSSQACETI